TSAGVNWIPTMKQNAREINLRTLRELAELGIRDFQLNFYFQCYLDLDNYNEYLTLADKLGINIHFLFREVEPIPELGNFYHETIGLMTPGEIERYSISFVMPQHGIIQNGKFAGKLDCNDVWFTNPVAGNIVSVKTYVYPREELNPFKRMIDVSEKLEYYHPPSPRGVIEYTAAGLNKYNGWVYTVLFKLRTPRLWVSAPVWDKEYFEKIYKGRHLKVVAEKAKFKSHPSVKSFASINEPTFTWNGGDVVNSLDFEKHWITFLRKTFDNSIKRLNQTFGTACFCFELMPYIPRVVYSGANHTHWSGFPGYGLNSNYEVIKTRFKHWLMMLSFQRMYEGIREVCGDYPVMVKFNWLNIDMMAKQGSGAYLAAKSPWLDIIGWDMYPLSLGVSGVPAICGPTEVETKGTKANDYIATMTSTAASVALLGKAYNKPAWLAETACGWRKKDEKMIAEVTTASFPPMLNMGIDQIHYWAVGPYSRPAGAFPYRMQEKTKSDRIRPSGKVLGKISREFKKKKRAVLPQFDILLAYPEDNVFLYNATDDGQSWVTCRTICERCHTDGILAVDEVLTPALLPHVNALMFYDGYYLSVQDKELIESYPNPILILGHAFPTNPIFGIKYDTKKEKDTDPYWINKKQELTLPNGKKVLTTGFGLILPPEGAVSYSKCRYGNKDYYPFFSLGNRLIFGFKLANPMEYIHIIKWWLSLGIA
ncbi:MAG: beta-galactosidase, partial [bacterium]|nr:beta-galactosidase [bacterium]